jgi:Pyruvate/2-oxoacid:ferredoxin oxidoreductase delta subunit
MLRKIVRIDEAKCDGCGQCIPACAEGAIALSGGKARLASDVLCDGLGACLGECPQGAIEVVEREAEAFDEAAVERRLAAGSRAAPAPASPAGAHPRTAPRPGARLPIFGHGAAPEGGCPGSRPMTLPGRVAAVPGAPAPTAGAAASRLGQWPVQLHLVPVNAPYFRGADLLVAADCVPFAYARFHDDLLAGRALVVGCPKLDDLAAYVDKLGRIFAANEVRSVTVARMEVPCCGGISIAARRSLAAASKDAVPFRDVVIGVDGAVRA